MNWPFGKKYRGWDVDDLPIHYLRWVVNESDLFGKMTGGLAEMRDAIIKRLHENDEYPYGGAPKAKQEPVKKPEQKPVMTGTNRGVSMEEHHQALQKIRSLEKDLQRSDDYTTDLENKVHALGVQVNNLKFENSLLKINRGQSGGFSGNSARGVNGDAKRIFRDLAFKWHPDRGGSQEAMKAINEFYDKLNGK
jgi:uncharacterized protein (DUF3820 family)